MELNANFEERAVVHAAKEAWVPSPMKGVERRMLDRIGNEVARATSIVRYAPGSHFSAHTHAGGEEFLVLDGVFQDEHGDYPTGTYVRNPPTSSHTPGSESGCAIFVKLWQFDRNDRYQMSVNTNAADWETDPLRQGVSTMALYSDNRETVAMEQWQPNARVELDSPNGLELLVLNGGFEENSISFERYSWLRLPKASKTLAIAGKDGCKLWVKRNHLREPPQPPSP